MQHLDTLSHHEATYSNGDSPLPDDWRQLTQIALRATAHSNGLIEQAQRQSDALLGEYLAHGCIRGRLLREALGWDELVGVLFFNKLYAHRHGDGRPPVSPVAHEPDPSWMAHADFCFVNVRATGKIHNETGNFIDATRLLPLLRVRAIHLAPFFENVFGIVYAQDSFAIISDDVTEHYYESQGFSRYQQLRYFIDCCHLLGKAVGFDLTAHTSGFSKLSLDRPELFRWVRFADDYDGLHGGLSIDEQYAEPRQTALAAHIAEVVGGICRGYGLECLENPDAPLATVRAAFRHAKRAVRSFGYYPVVPHTWNGVGLPGLAGYNKAGHYPIWDYRDSAGEDQSAHAMGIHASFKFHTGLLANRAPFVEDPSWSAESWTPTIDYLAGLFPALHRRYGFDFLRIDYVDHVFRGTRVEQGREVVLCEQLSPSQLRQIAETARAAFPACGMLADHVGNDIDRYREAGFTVILGKEVQYPLRKHNLLELFADNYRLQQAHAHNPRYGTVLFPIDTHDMGHPALLGRDLAEREGRATIQLRHLFARFATAWVGRRPKYEVIGNQDMSAGIYRANNRPESLTWGDDRAHLAAYHAIEDAFEQCRDELRNGMVTANYIYDDYCWWRIDTQAGATALLVLTWFGEQYDYAQAGARLIQTMIPLPQPAGRRATVEPVLGIRPAPAPDAVEQVLVPGSALRVTQEQDMLLVTWPALTSWVLRIRYDEPGIA